MFDLRLLFVALVWGVNFPVIKHSLTDFLPLSFTVVRFAIASAALSGSWHCAASNSVLTAVTFPRS